MQRSLRCYALVAYVICAGLPLLHADSGGPDAFGHLWTEDIAFDWLDASGGTDTSINADDGWYGPFELGFQFAWYGVGVAQFYASPDGAINFSTDLGTSILDCSTYGLSAEPNNYITIGGDRRVSTNEGAWVKYLTLYSAPNRVCVIEYHNLRRSSNTFTERFDLEFVVYENGGNGEKVAISARNLNTLTDLRAYIGCENADGTDYLVYNNGCPGNGNTLGEGKTVTIQQGLGSYCVDVRSTRPSLVGATNSIVEHTIEVFNCGAEDNLIELVIAGNTWDVTITDLAYNPITSVFLNSLTTTSIKLLVSTPTNSGTDSVLLQASNTSKSTTDYILLTTVALHNFDSFDDDPMLSGWTLGSAAWQWGPAQLSNCSYGSDPYDDTSPSSNNYILGYALGGCYDNNLAATEYATSPIYDFSGFYGLKLHFNRWLGIESTLYDHASVQLSTDGESWVTVWQNPVLSIYESTWSHQELDISAYADDEPAVQVRFGLGPTDSSVVFFGWNLDDVGFSGTAPGVIEGTVTGLGGLLDGATVTITQNEQSVQTIAGFYSITLGAGVYTVQVSAPGHNTATVTGVSLEEGQTVVLHFILTYPLITIEPEYFMKTLELGTTATEPLLITNNGTGNLELGIELDIQDSDLFTLVFDYDIQAQTNVMGNFGCEFDGSNVWITSQNEYLDGVLSKFDRAGQLIAQYPQNSASPYGMRDLAFDGVFLYAGDEEGFYRIDPADGSVTTLFTSASFPGELTVIRGLAYNPSSDTFYGCDWNDPLVEFNRLGTELGSYDLALHNCYGLAFDSYTMEPGLWVFEQSETSTTTLRKFTAQTLVYSGLSFEVPLLSGAEGQSAGGLFITDQWGGHLVIGGLAQAVPHDRLFGLNLASWLSLSSYQETVTPPPEPASKTIQVYFDARSVPRPGEYNGELVVNHNAGGDRGVIHVPVTLQVTADYAVELSPLEQHLYGPIGSAVNGTIRVWNLGAIDDLYTLSVADNTWFVEFPDHPSGVVSVPAGQSADVMIVVQIPPTGVAVGDGDQAEITFTSQGSSVVQHTVSILTYIYQTIPWSTDFETNCFFTTTNMSGGFSETVWECGFPAYGPTAPYSGAVCWGTDLDADYYYYSYTALTTFPIYLNPQFPKATVQFRHWFQIEEGWDSAWLEINAGSGWLKLDPQEGYPDPLYDVFTGNSGDWLQHSYDLSGYVDKIIRLRWLLRTDFSINDPGWYIDDVEIAPVLGVFVTPTVLNQWNFPNSDSQLLLSVLNGTGSTASFNVALEGLTWSYSAPVTIGPINSGETSDLAITITIPSSAAPLDHESGLIHVTGSDPNVADDVAITVGAGAPAWELRAPLPSARCCTDLVYHHGLLYSPSGFDQTGMGRIYIYDPVNDLWSNGPAAPVAVADFGAAVIGDVIYVPCGQKVVGNVGYFDVQAYDTQSATWTELGRPFPGYGSVGQAVTAHSNGLLYVFGGLNVVSGQLSNEAFSFSSTEGWTELATMTNRLYYARAASDGERRVYLAGGHDGEHLLDTIEMYDVLEDTWTFVTTLPEARYAGALEYYRDHLIYIGGLGPGWGNEVYGYGPLGSDPQWFQLPDLTVARSRFGAAMAVESNGSASIYAGAGRSGVDDEAINSLEQYVLVFGAEVPALNLHGLIVLVALVGFLLVGKKRR